MGLQQQSPQVSLPNRGVDRHLLIAAQSQRASAMMAPRAEAVMCPGLPDAESKDRLLPLFESPELSRMLGPCYVLFNK